MAAVLKAGEGAESEALYHMEVYGHASMLARVKQSGIWMAEMGFCYFVERMHDDDGADIIHM